jgi:hypothetical protein
MSPPIQRGAWVKRMAWSHDFMAPDTTARRGKVEGDLVPIPLVF